MYWTVHLEGGPRRVNHAAVVVGDKIYSFGGYCTGENYCIKRPMDIHVLNTVNLRWKALPIPSIKDEQYAAAPYQRYGHSAVAYGTKVYIWGGRNDEAACNKLFCFHTDTLKWSCVKTYGAIPGARDGHSACILNNSMYIFGGFVEEVDRYSQDMYVLNLLNMHWTYLHTKGEPPTFRDFHSATAIGNRMYVFGGRGDRNGPHHSQMEMYCSDIMYLDTEINTWHRPVTLGESPTGRRSHSAFLHDDYLYIFGGYNSILDQHFNDLHRFCPKRHLWESIKTLGESPSKRRRQSCHVIDDKMYLFGGTSPVDEYVMSINDHQDLDSKLMDHDDLHVLDFRPTLVCLCMVTVIKYQLDPSGLPEDIKWELRAMSTNNCIRPPTNTG